jgi:hypothetical protein
VLRRGRLPMIVHHFFQSRLLTIGILAAFVLLVAPIAPFAQLKAPAAGGSLVGFIYDKDMKSPVPNAIVKLRNIAKATDYESEPSDANGMYKISGIEEGRYIMGVNAPRGGYNFYYTLALRGNEIAKLSVALQDAPQPTGTTADQKGFFKSPMGIVTVVLVAGAVLYGLLSKKEEASPIR